MESLLINRAKTKLLEAVKIFFKLHFTKLCFSNLKNNEGINLLSNLRFLVTK